MKKTRLLPLLVLLLACLCAGSALAQSGIAGQVYIASVTDRNGPVSSLTDGSTATTWTKTASGYGADLTINLYSATVGEIWIRSGHCYSQNYFNHYDRPSVVAVTLWYSANRYTTTSVTYRYRLSDSFRPGTYSASWNDGYQRILLPERISGVTSIELTIESSRQGYGSTGATITDIIVASGSHATATPRAYATATPRPYVEYVTPSPTPYVHRVTPTPTYRVEIITPTPTRGVVLLTPEPTRTPLVELITPVPQVTNPPIVIPSTDYPTEGVMAELLKTAATRSGPSNDYDEPGSFYSAGDYVNVVSKAWDPENDIWWFQIELNYRGEWMRAYTPANRIDLDPSLVPTENDDGDAREVLLDHRVYFGPGYEYKMYKVSMLYKGSRAVIYGYEEKDGMLWAQVHYHDYAIGEDRRGWVPAEVLSEWPFSW
ncbi:MAG: hypothetical protein E7327_12195 [Clostridiales bacterium]|nr:hypothetical protein [Clostridiales bacterium]